MPELSTKELIDLRVQELDQRAEALKQERKDLRKEALAKASEWEKERKSEIKEEIMKVRAERKQMTGSATGVTRKGAGRWKKQADVEASRTETFSQLQEEDNGSSESVAAE